MFVANAASDFNVQNLNLLDFFLVANPLGSSLEDLKNFHSGACEIEPLFKGMRASH